MGQRTRDYMLATIGMDSVSYSLDGGLWIINGYWLIDTVHLLINPRISGMTPLVRPRHSLAQWFFAHLERLQRRPIRQGQESSSKGECTCVIIYHVIPCYPSSAVFAALLVQTIISIVIVIIITTKKQTTCFLSESIICNNDRTNTNKHKLLGGFNPSETY